MSGSATERLNDACETFLACLHKELSCLKCNASPVCNKQITVFKLAHEKVNVNM